jgi:hypothetical protein
MGSSRRCAPDGAHILDFAGNGTVEHYSCYFRCVQFVQVDPEYWNLLCEGMWRKNILNAPITNLSELR